MYRVAVIGDRDSVYGFSALGLDVCVIEPEHDPVREFKRLTSGEYAVIYITEALAAQLEEEIGKFADAQRPAVILIPGVSGNTGKGMSAVKKSVEKAVGSDIIFND